VARDERTWMAAPAGSKLAAGGRDLQRRERVAVLQPVDAEATRDRLLAGDVYDWAEGTFFTSLPEAADAERTIAKW